MLDDVTIYPLGDRLAVTSPYYEPFIQAIRALGGRWVAPAKAWTVHTFDEAALRALLRSHYGDDGETPSSEARVSVPLPSHIIGDSFIAAGRTWVSRRYRDSPVALHPNAVVTEGGFPGSGGSQKNPRLEHSAGTRLELRDIPLGVAQLVVAEVPGATILTAPAAQTRAERVAAIAATVVDLAREVSASPEEVCAEILAATKEAQTPAA